MLTAQKEEPANFGIRTVALVNGADFLKNHDLHEEVFGPYSLVVACENKLQILEIISRLGGQLTGTIIAQNEELDDLHELIKVLSTKVGRLIFNGVPTGVEVTAAMTHGGPYPATTDSRFTAVGTDAIRRWLRPITYQNFPAQFDFFL